jgi:hypothetical protein
MQSLEQMMDEKFAWDLYEKGEDDSGKSESPATFCVSYTTSWKVAGSIADVIGFFQLT